MGAAAGQPGADWTPGETQPAKWMDPHQRTYYKEATREAPPYPTRPFDETAPTPPPPQGHVNRPNSFTGMSDPVKERNEKLQQILNKTLGADYIASRQGGGGSKLNYLEGWRAINLANEVFGFNGWFTDIKYLEADFVRVVSPPRPSRAARLVRDLSVTLPSLTVAAVSDATIGRL